jgi:GTPase SAR1 family protein
MAQNKALLLDLTGKNLDIIPDDVFKLTNLRTLILDNNNLTDIPSSISELANLEVLSLNSNKLKTVNTNISKLTKLKTLSIADNNLTELHGNIFNISNLKSLFAYDNKINNLSKDISRLKKLETLILSNNNLTEIPKTISNLRLLQEINLSHNKIIQIPKELYDIQKLELIDLSYNQLSEIPKLISELPKLVNLSLRGNPLELPPQEIAFEKDLSSNNINKIRKYFREFTAGNTDYLFEIKLLLLGEGRVGKTSIAKTITDPKYRLENEASTQGIEITPWVMSKKEFKKNKNEISPQKNLRINIWDFGGQEIYHSTHQFFLTKRSVYLLVTESRQEDKPDDFYYWLNCIKLLGDNSPTLIIQNKCDQPLKDLPIKEFKKEFPNILSSIRISCKNGYSKTIIELKNEIKNIVSNSNLLPHLGTPLPKVWVDIRKEIELLQDVGKDYFEYNQYLNICKKHGLNEERAGFICEFYHDLGVLLHFHEDWNLKETIFINHEWVTNSVYRVLDNEYVIKNYGVFEDKDLEVIWQPKEYSSKRRELLALMMKFELCFELSKKKYLVPQLLPVDEIEIQWISSNTNLTYEYHYHFMPKGILTRLIVKRSSDIFDNKYWRHGVILHYANTKALIREKYFERKISIEISGENKKLLLELIKKSISEIHSDFSNIQFEELIPCNCDKCKNESSPNLYKLSELEVRLKKDKQSIECYKSYDIVSIKQILEQVKMTPDTNISNLMPRIKNNIFISYSHKDRIWLDKILSHIKVLNKEGIETLEWSDLNIKASQKWKKEIYNALESAKIGILLISTDFLNSDFIIDNELPLLLRNAETKGTKLIPVILRPCRFTKNIHLSQFQSINDPRLPLSKLKEYEQEEIMVELTNRIEELIREKK